MRIRSYRLLRKIIEETFGPEYVIGTGVSRNALRKMTAEEVLDTCSIYDEDPKIWRGLRAKEFNSILELHTNRLTGQEEKDETSSGLCKDR
jgi:hypothetical protein